MFTILNIAQTNNLDTFIIHYSASQTLSTEFIIHKIARTPLFILVIYNIYLAHEQFQDVFTIYIIAYNYNLNGCSLSALVH